ncbi:substrate-binding domain-containing protein [Kitasatospora purpeofusca]|uniref:substrate-binding domain-containing protein n=1 Tax=Kitasatospora purpeofusca TaxID=67352 RepID=UPI002A5A90A0|nr:substrate-binding domain-containing protein [Kitasatospora purpeofusca]MDY0811040.1 substrate-binding domain-containing protein [Kitasatospora purpeofusca]
MRKAIVRLLTSTALALSSAVGLGGGPAVADPWTPAATDIVGVGGHSSAALLSRLSQDYNAFLAGNGDTTSPRLYSWDAVGPSPIVPKSGAAAIARPMGAEAGLRALTNTTSATVDFARVERSPRASPEDTSANNFVALAKDAVSWAAKGSGHAPANLTSAQLKNIYECTVTNWRQIDPTLPDATIKPRLPFVGSAVRAHFLRTVNQGTDLVPGACVVSRTDQIEDQGTDPWLDDDDVVLPYSVGHYAGQVYRGHASGADAAGPMTIRSINGIAPVDPVLGRVSPAFANTTYGRVVNNVVRRADWDAGDVHAAALKAIFGTQGWICMNAAGAAAVADYGFIPLPKNACGSVSRA